MIEFDCLLENSALPTLQNSGKTFHLFPDISTSLGDPERIVGGGIPTQYERKGVCGLGCIFIIQAVRIMVGGDFVPRATGLQFRRANTAIGGTEIQNLVGQFARRCSPTPSVRRFRLISRAWRM